MTPSPSINARLQQERRSPAGRHRKLDDAGRAKVRRLHAEGVTRRNLAERFGVSRSLIDNAINEGPSAADRGSSTGHARELGPAAGSVHTAGKGGT